MMFVGRKSLVIVITPKVSCYKLSTLISIPLFQSLLLSLVELWLYFLLPVLNYSMLSYSYGLSSLSDHYLIFALLNLPIFCSESATNLTNKYYSSSFSSTDFNSHLTTGVNKLMALPNCRVSEISMEKCSSKWPQTVMDAVNLSSKIKTTRRLHFAYFFSSLSILLNIKIRTAIKCNYRNGTIERVRQQVSLSVELDKTVPIENLSLQSTRSSFNFFRSFSSNRLSSQTM